MRLNFNLFTLAKGTIFPDCCQILFYIHAHPYICKNGLDRKAKHSWDFVFHVGLFELLWNF